MPSSRPYIVHEELRSKPWLAALILVPACLVTILFASFFFAIFISVFLVLGAILGARFWWLRRRLKKSGGRAIIDGEFIVVDRRITFSTDDRDRDRGARDD